MTIVPNKSNLRARGIAESTEAKVLRRREGQKTTEAAKQVELVICRVITGFEKPSREPALANRNQLLLSQPFKALFLPCVPHWAFVAIQTVAAGGKFEILRRDLCGLQGIE